MRPSTAQTVLAFLGVNLTVIASISAFSGTTLGRSVSEEEANTIQGAYACPAKIGTTADSCGGTHTVLCVGSGGKGTTENAVTCDGTGCNRVTDHEDKTCTCGGGNYYKLKGCNGFSVPDDPPGPGD